MSYVIVNKKTLELISRHNDKKTAIKIKNMKINKKDLEIYKE